MQGCARTPPQPRTRPQPCKNQASEKKVNVSAAEKARQRYLRREYRVSLEKDISNLRKKLKQEVDTHKALERAFRRTLGVLPRFSPSLTPKVQELLAEVAVLEEEVINLEECIIALRQGLYNEAVYLSASKQQKETNDSVPLKDGLPHPKLPLQVRHNQSVIKAKRNSVIAKLLPPIVETKLEDGSAMARPVDCVEGRNTAEVGVIPLDRANNLKYPTYSPQESRKNQQRMVEETATPRVTVPYPNLSVRDFDNTLEKENQQKEAQKAGIIGSQDDNVKKGPEMIPKLCSSHLENGDITEPNLLSEEMVWCLSSIFLRLTKHSSSCFDWETMSNVSQSTLSSVWSLNSRNSVSCNPSREVTEEIEFIDPYKICIGSSISRSIGPYQYFQEVTANSFDYSKIPRTAIFLKKLLNLLERLRNVELRGLTHQQKLSFWINIYNVCMMHAFLEQGIPDSPDRVLALMAKAVINVGGHLLSALAIEHFILRLPCDFRSAQVEWKCSKERTVEGLMRSTYGLDWPEPLVSFALCCGSWSSPALRIYTPQDVEQELEIAKTEYLQAAVGVMTSKVVIPKMLDWYRRDFAKDAESLMEWVCEQLPTALSESVQRCLDGRAMSQAVVIMPYDFSFRYLIAVQP